MEIVRVEPTPSPNTMKIVLSEKREDNQSNTYTEVRENQPQFINDLLKLEGVKSIFYVMDFLAIDKIGKTSYLKSLQHLIMNQAIIKNLNQTNIMVKFVRKF